MRFTLMYSVLNKLNTEYIYFYTLKILLHTLLLLLFKIVERLKCILNYLVVNAPINIETSQLICSTNLLTGFYVIGPLFVNGSCNDTITLTEKYFFWSVFSCIYSGSDFPVFRLNTEKYEPEITPYLDTFHPVSYSSPRQMSQTFCNSILVQSQLFHKCLK